MGWEGVRNEVPVCLKCGILFCCTILLFSLFSVENQVCMLNNLLPYDFLIMKTDN
jgi:hypothetical protein